MSWFFLRKVLFSCAIVLLMTAASEAATAKYVISISVDGMGSSYLNSLMASLPNFQRLASEGASTTNARNDYDITVTLPTHTTMLTGRGINGTSGHNWTSNSDPAAGQTIQSNKGSYVASVFDVAHDNGLRTGLYAGKTKFSLFDTSYNATNGANDVTDVNNGKDKIDTYAYNSSESSLVASYLSAMSTSPYNFSMLHLADPDAEGHAHGWGSTEYNTAIKAADTYLGQILNLVNTNATLKGNTTVIVTADHGGTGKDHSDATNALDYTIPFYVWGAGVTAGADLYALNSGSRLTPGTSRPSYSAPIQPVRNGEVANLSLDLLGLDAVPGSTIDFSQNLTVPEPSSAVLLLVLGIGLGLRFFRRRLA